MTFPGTPTIISYDSGNANLASWPAFSDVPVSAGSLAVFGIASDGNPTLSTASTGWQKHSQRAGDFNNASCALFYRAIPEDGSVATIGFTLSATASEKFAGILYIVPGADSLSATNAIGTSTAADPPSHDALVSRDHLWIALYAGITVASGAPSGYGELTTEASTGAGPTGISAAYKLAAAQTEDPGGFTNPNDNWITYTVAVYSSSIAHSLTLDAGSYAQAGTAVTFKAGHRIAPSPGSYSLAGPAIGLGKTIKFAIAPGSYVHGGNTVGFRASLKVNLAPGAYPLGGTAVGLGKGMKLAVGTGAYGLSGQAIGLWARRRLSFGAGDHAMAGTAFGLGHGQSFAIGPGAYALGYDPIMFSRTHAPTDTPALRTVAASDMARLATVPHQARHVRPAAVHRIVHLSGRGE